MKNDIVLVPFPFDDFKTSKVRPALCLTGPFGNYNHRKLGNANPLLIQAIKKSLKKIFELE